MSYRILFALLLIAFAGKAQSTLSKTEVDLGKLYAGSQRFVDISIENPGSSRVHVLRIEQSPNVVYKLSSEVIESGGFITMRVQVNPSSKGAFELGCDIYMSDLKEPLHFRLKGNVMELPKNTFTTTACPDFNAAPAANTPSDLTIETVDKATGELLARSKVVIIRNGEPAGAWLTGKKGSFEVRMPSGYFYFLATKEGYLKKEAGIYVDPTVHVITIPLVRDPELVVDVIEPEIIPETADSLGIDVAEAIIEEVVQQADTITPLNPELSELDADNFEEQFFKPVNIEFVIDVSSSMKQNDKMELMKYAMNQLIGELRPVDRMGIVTYSDNAHVFQDPTLCDRKEIILNSISQLQPEGLTAGGRGIKLGYRQLMLNYDPSKTNIVIIVTDGAFNKDSDDYQKTVKRYAKKGVIFSVVGIQSRPNDETKMTEAANFGKGRYVGIHELSDAQAKLFQEIRAASFKGTK